MTTTSYWTNWGPPIRKVLALAITSLVSAAGFLAWLNGQGDANWREWVAVIITAIAAPVAGYLMTPDGLSSPWWPIRKIAAGCILALASSTGFLAWLSHGGLTTGQILAIVVTAVVPVLVGWLVPSPDAPPGGATAVVTASGKQAVA